MCIYIYIYLYKVAEAPTARLSGIYTHGGHTCIHMYVYIYIYIYTHTRIHTYKCIYYVCV